MHKSRTLCLMLVAAAFLPLHPKLAHAEGAYASFKPPQRQLDAMLSNAYKRCGETSDGVTAIMIDCIDTEFSRLDRRLNVSYQAKLARLPRAGVQRLRSQQRGWLATREEGCLNELKEDRENGGTIYSVLLFSCRMEELQRRILWIEGWGIEPQR